MANALQIIDRWIIFLRNIIMEALLVFELIHLMDFLDLDTDTIRNIYHYIGRGGGLV